MFLKRIRRRRTFNTKRAFKRDDDDADDAGKSDDQTTREFMETVSTKAKIPTVLPWEK